MREDNADILFQCIRGCRAFHSLPVFAHKFFIDEILDHKSAFSAEVDGSLAENPVSSAQVQYDQVAGARVEG